MTEAQMARIYEEYAAHEAEVVASIAPVDPNDVICITGWAGTKGYNVDEVWMRNGQTFAALSPRSRDAFTPPDVTVYRFDREQTEMTAVAWIDGTRPFDPSMMDPECSICRHRHPSDDRHACE